MKKLEIIVEKRPFLPGDRFQGKLILRNDKPIKVRDVHLDFKGKEYTSVYVSHGRSGHTYHSTNHLVNKRRVMAQEGQIPPGEHVYDFEFACPHCGRKAPPPSV